LVSWFHRVCIAVLLHLELILCLLMLVFSIQSHPAYRLLEFLWYILQHIHFISLYNYLVHLLVVLECDTLDLPYYFGWYFISFPKYWRYLQLFVFDSCCWLVIWLFWSLLFEHLLPVLTWWCSIAITVCWLFFLLLK